MLLAEFAFGQSESNPSDGELIFQSGFENDSKVINQKGDSDLVGADKSLSACNDWVNDLDNHPDIGDFNIQYQGGDSTMRYARIIAEPGNDLSLAFQNRFRSAQISDLDIFRANVFSGCKCQRERASITGNGANIDLNVVKVGNCLNDRKT